MKRFLSLLLALAIAGSTLSPAWAAESPLPEPEEITTLSMLNPLLEADGEEAAQSALDALAQAPFEDKLLTLAQTMAPPIWSCSSAFCPILART